MFLRNRLYIVCMSVFMLMGCGGNKADNKQKSNEELNIEALTQAVASEIMDDDDRGYVVKVGDIAPDFTMMLPNGDSVQLSSLRGKVVMLQFTASWCGVCRKEMPHIENDIWKRHKDNPAFALYGIDREEPVEKVNELIEKTGVTYPIGLDPDAGIFTLFAEETAGITRNVIIDRDGKIVMLTRLFEMEEFNEMVQVIDNLLAN